MNELKEYTKSQLIKHNIKEDLSQKIEEIKEDLQGKDLQSAYKTLLNSLRERKMYYNILKNKTVFDIQIFIPRKKFFFKEEEIQKRLKEKLNFKYVYFSDNFLGIKLKNDCYNCGRALIKETVPYKKLYRSIRKYVDFYDLTFKELVFRVNHRDNTKEFINFINKIHLPVKIYDYELINPISISNYKEIDLVLEDRDWPEEEIAKQCAKTAFYCYLHSKIRSNELICKNHLIIKYNGINFVLTVQTNTNLRKYFNELIDQKEEWWKYNVLYVKTFLSSFGFYSFYFSDLLIDLLCYKIKDFYAPSFLNYFLSLDYNFNMIFNLDTKKFTKSKKDLFLQINTSLYKIETPDESIINRLKLLNKKIKESKFKIIDEGKSLVTNNYLLPNINDYDFVLSNKPRKNFNKIDFDGLFSYYELKEISLLCYLFYSERHGLIMVKDRGIGIDVLIGLVVLKSGFNYIRINKI